MCCRLRNKVSFLLLFLVIPVWSFCSKSKEDNTPIMQMPMMGPIDTPAFMMLDGDWDFLAMAVSYDQATSVTLKSQWGTIPVPALWWEAKMPKVTNVDWMGNLNSNPPPDYKPAYITTPFAWYRKHFTLDTTNLAILTDTSTSRVRIQFGQVKWSCEAWLNGHRIGYHLGGYAPFDFEVTPWINRNGDNELILKVGGWGSIPMSKEGLPEITTGTVADWANKAGGITESVQLRIYKRVAIQSVFAIPHASDSTVEVRVTVKNPKDLLPGDQIDVYLTDTKSMIPINQLTLDVDRDTATGLAGTDLFVTIPEAKLWWPWSPTLYEVTAMVKSKDGTPLDIQKEVFGLRDFTEKDGHFYLNGQRIQLRGANLFQEAAYGAGSKATNDIDFAERYLVDVARQGNITAFRTHLGPMNQRWLDLCDAAGVLIISEFPLSPPSNNWEDTTFGNFAFQEYKDLIPYLWNHPSIIMWSISNESRTNEKRAIENGYVYPLIKRLDPTRLILRAGDISPDMLDLHAFEGVMYKTMGDFRKRVESINKIKRTLPVMCTEYLETGSDDSGVWNDMERAKRLIGPNPTPDEMILKHAELAAEQTEILRTSQYDGIFPYWYADWVNLDSWLAHADDTTYPHKKMTYYALKNALAPVAISVDPQTTSLKAGENLTAKVSVINDTPGYVPVKIQVYILTDNPFYLPSRVKEFSQTAQFYDTSSSIIPSFSVVDGNIVIPIPKNVNGDFYLVTLLTYTNTNESVLSQRRIHIEGTIPTRRTKGKKKS